MQNLFNYKDRIFEIKRKVESKDPDLFSHTSIPNRIIDENTITIVMTASNRSRQTYFTLKRIHDSNYKNIQIIIVDDSDIDPIDIAVLKERNYPFYIDLIKIKRENKNWHNPLVNYNIGFQYIKGTKLIIQNAEFCHIGDVLSFVNENVLDNNYYVFDVKASLNYETNEIIMNSDLNTIDIYNRDIYYMWYQNIERNYKLHFLTCLTTETFKKIQDFSYDYTMGSCYDDDDFLLKVISQRINICNIFHNEYNIGGIHLFHGISTDYGGWDRNIESNEYLFKMKKNKYEILDKYIDITENKEKFEQKYVIVSTIT